MSEPKEKTGRPRKRRSRIGRFLRTLIELVGMVFFLGVVFLWWASRTGQAGDWARERMVIGLHDRCDVLLDPSVHVTFDPFPPTVDMTNVKLTHLDGRPILSVDEAIATLQVLPLFANRVQLDRVSVLRPKATIELVDGGIVDLPKCVQPPEKKAASVPIVLGITELVVERGTFDLKIDQDFGADLQDIYVSLAPRGGSGGSNVTISVDNSTVRYAARTFPVERFRFQGHLEGLLTEPRAALIDTLDIKVARAHLGASGSIDLLGPVYDANLTFEAPLDVAHDFIADFPATEGTVRLAFRLQGTAAAPHGVGKLELHDAKIDQFEIGDDLALDFSVDRKRLDISKLDIHVAEGRVRGKGSINLENPHFPVKIETEADELSLGRVLDCVGIHKAWVDWRTAGKGIFNGTLLNPTELRGSFDYSIRDFFVYNGPWDRPEVKNKRDPDPLYLLLRPSPAEVRGKWSWSEKGIGIDDAELTGGDTHGTADARVGFAVKDGISVHADLTSFDFKDLGPIAGIKFGGRGHISGGLSGPHTNISGGGTVELDDVTVTGIPFGHARAELKWHDDFAIDFTDIKARFGETDYSGNLGVFVRNEVPFTIRGSIAKGRIEDVLVPFGVRREDWGNPTGGLTGTFELAGPISRLTGPIDLILADAQILGEKFESAQIGARLERGAIVADDAVFQKHGAQMQVSGRIDPFGNEVRAHLRSRNMTLQKIDLVKASTPNLDADLGIDLGLSGNLSGVTGTVAIQAVRVVAGPLELQDGRLTGSIKGKTIAIKGHVLGDALKVEGEVDLTRGLPYRTTLDLREYDVPKLVAALNGHLRYKGLLAARARLAGSLIDWPLSSGEIQLDRGEIETESGAKFETASAASFVLKSGVLETKRISFVGPSTKLTAEGKLGSKIVDLKVVGKVDLGIMEVLSPAIDRVGGSLFIDSAIGGAPGNMNLVGTGRVDNAFLEWRGFYGRLIDASASMSFSQSTILIDRAEGRWADGKISASGNLLFENFRLKSASLQIGVEDALPKFKYPTVWLSGLINGTLSVEGTPTKLLVRGDLDVARGDVKPILDVRSLVGRTRVGANAYDPSAEILDLDIAFHTKNPVRMKNETIDTELKGDLRLTGTNQRIGLLGSATVLQGGRVSFVRDYEMISGSIDFQDRYRFYPRYDLWVQTDACSSRIRVNLVGTLDKFDSNYSSNPAMDENNILSCLIRGIRVQDTDTKLGSDIASGSFWKASGLDRQVRKVLPVDDINLTTEYSLALHAFEPRVLVAKDLTIGTGTARLEYSSSLARSEDRRLALRYRVSPQLTLQGSWVNKIDTQLHPIAGDVGLDLKYRWEW